MPALSHLCDDTRADWGAAPARKTSSGGSIEFVDIAEKVDFLTHHDGASRLFLADKSHDACLARVRAVQAMHVGNGWGDIGYNTLTCPHGRLIEGRGVLAVGAQCPGHNRSGVGSQMMVGGSDPLLAVMLDRQRRFYDDLVALRGPMRKMGHRDGVSTECPGDELEKWVKAGMPATGTPSTTPTTNQQEDDMPTPRDLWAYEYNGRQALGYLVTADANARAARIDAAAALAIVKAQAEKGTALTEAEIDAIGKRVGAELAAGFDVELTPKGQP